MGRIAFGKLINLARQGGYILWLLCAPLFIIAGLTGAMQAFYYEIDETLNPQFYNVPISGPPLSSPELIAKLETAHPELKVWYIQSAARPGRTAMMTTEARGEAHLVNDTFYVDPANGREVGARSWGQCCFQRKNLLNWTYEVHHSLASGEIGRWIMGSAAIVGLLASAIVIIEGVRRRDRLHVLRAIVAVPCLVLAVTSIDLNLADEVFKPAVSVFSKVTPDVYTVRGQMTGGFGPRNLSYDDALRIGRAEGQRRGYGSVVGELYYSYGYNFYGMAYGYRDPVGMGNHWLYFDGATGQVIGGRFPGEGTAGDRFTQFQLPFHSGRLGGIWTKSLICFLGLMIAGVAGASLVQAGRRFKARLSDLRAPYDRAHRE